MASAKQLAVRVLNEPLAAIDAFFRQQGLDEWSIKSKPDHKTVIARARDGNAVRYSVYTSNGFCERTLSSCDRLPPARRKAEAKRLSKKGLTQTEIAERLGCSQKTVSNDLR